MASVVRLETTAGAMVQAGCHLRMDQGPTAHEVAMMTVIKATVVVLVWTMLVAGGTSVGIAGEQRRALLKQYWGKITSIRVDRCGKRPGLCEGTIIVAQRQGGEVTLAIRPGTWIKRDERLVLLEELSVGNEIHVQAIEMAGDGGMRATTIDVTTRP